LKLFGAAAQGCAGRGARSDRGGEVVRKLEPGFAVVECENPVGYCRSASYSTLRSAMREAVQAFLERLDQHVIEDLVRLKRKLRQLLVSEDLVGHKLEEKQ
jgi:Rrf2 family transcriptional regulator, nitric oxide-sensitive transcriptional repressor